MNNNYIDVYGRYHHKPVTEIKPIPSNNGWIYTAYAKKLGLPVDQFKTRNCFTQCTNIMDRKILRSPGKELPPISRDEILGLSYLGYLIPIYMNGFNFSPRPLPKFNAIKFVTQGIKLLINRNDRNYFWENNLDQFYRFSFSAPFSDRYFLIQNGSVKANIFSMLIYKAIAKVDSLIGKDSGIRFLKYGKSKEAMLKEFPADHPLRSA